LKAVTVGLHSQPYRFSLFTVVPRGERTPNTPPLTSMNG
jgi:hypothetical protein